MAEYYPGATSDNCIVQGGANFSADSWTWVGYDYDTYIRFPNVAIPQGVTITSAKLTFTSVSNTAEATCNALIQCNDVDASVAPTNLSQFNALALTAASVAWDAVVAFENGLSYDSPSLVSIVQEIVDRAGWASGNAIGFVVADNSSSVDAYRYAGKYGASPPKLTVTYSTFEVSIDENFTINAAIDAWKTPDTLSENFTINADMKASAEFEGPISEDFSINAVMSLIRETPKEATAGFTINADMDVIATFNKTFDGSDATISAAIQANSTYNKGLATTAYLGSFMDAEFEYPVKRKKMPYRAQGKRLSIKIECTDKGSWMKLLDISAKVLPMVGRTQSDATKVRGTGNHVGVKISNTDGAAIQLSYVGMKIERYPAR